MVRHFPWHRESDGETFFVALDAEGQVVSAYCAERLVEPGVTVAWDPCAELARMTHDMRAGGWHPMGGPSVEWPPSIEEPTQ